MLNMFKLSHLFGVHSSDKRYITILCPKKKLHTLKDALNMLDRQDLVKLLVTTH